VFPTPATEYRSWFRTLRRDPQSQAIAEEVCGATGYLPKDENLIYRVMNEYNAL